MEGTPVYVGIDWSWQQHAVCIIDGDGNRLSETVLPHTGAGLAALSGLLRRWGADRVGIERGDGPVVEHLLRDGFEVIVITARQVVSLRARHASGGSKDDRFDAYVIADALRTDAGRWRPVVADSPAVVALRMLVRTRQDLVAHRVAVCNQLYAVLQNGFSGAIGLFSGLDNAISLAFLHRFPTVATAAWLTEERLADWLAGQHYPRRRATLLFARLRDAVDEHPAAAVSAAAERIVLSLVELLTALRAQIRAIEKDITAGLHTHPDGPIFTSLPRAGTIRAATLLAEIGDCRERFPDEAALAAAAGVAPVTRQSGSHRSVGYRRGCSKQLRNALLDWAQDTPRDNTWAADTYQRAKARGCRHPHAARILARAWTRILWRCWQDHTPYNPALHGRLHALETLAA